MGADLYINSIADKRRKKYDKAWSEAVAARNKYFDTIPDMVKNATATWHEPTKEELKQVKNCYPQEYKEATRLQREVMKYYSLVSGGDAHFRCSYGYNFFTNLGLSWWQDYSLLLDDDNNLSVEHAIDLAETLRANAVEIPPQKILDDYNCNTEEETKQWVRYMNQHKQDFINFLELAIHVGEPVYSSI